MILENVGVGKENVLGRGEKGFKEFVNRVEGGRIWMGGVGVGIGEGGFEG